MAHRKKTPPGEPLKVCSVKLTPTTEQILHRLSQDASDNLGWTVSNSAMLRALVVYAGHQPPSWAATTLHPIVEEEISQGRVWGTKKDPNSGA